MNVHVRRPDGQEEVFTASADVSFRYEVREDGRLVVLARGGDAGEVRYAEYSRYGWHRVHRSSAREQVAQASSTS